MLSLFFFIVAVSMGSWHDDIIDHDPSGVNDALSRLRHCGKVPGTYFLIQKQLYMDMMLLQSDSNFKI